MRPLRLADWFLRLLVRQGVVEDLIGDLREEYALFKLEELGPARAGFWYWNQVVWILLRYGRFKWPGTRKGHSLAGAPLGRGSSGGMDLRADLRFSLRRIWACPGVSLTIIVTLGLGIGVTSAVFSAVNGVLLEPLPYRSPQGLVVVGGEGPGLGSSRKRVSAPEYQDYLRGAVTVTDLAAMWPLDANLTSEGAPARVSAAVVTPNFFSLLGVEPALGRDFRAEDTEGNIGYRGILTHQAWVRHFNQDAGIIGRGLRVEDDPITIIGVLPQDFSHPSASGDPEVEIYAPIDLSEGTLFYSRGLREFTVIGRLADGVPLRESQVEFQALSKAQGDAFPGQYPPGGGWRVTVRPLLEEMVGNARTTLSLLFGSVFLVFLVVCTNVANLQLSRGYARAEEMAVRASIGGSRWRIARQLFLESFALGTMGCAAGVGVAFLGVHILRDLLSPAFPRLGNVEMNSAVLVFALGASLVSVFVFGLFPAIRHSNVGSVRVMDPSPGRPKPGRFSLRASFAGVQTALSLVLLVGAGLLFKSLNQMGTVDLGFDPEGVFTMRTWLPLPNDRSEGAYISTGQRSAFFQRALMEMGSIPGVSRAAVTSLLPFRGRDGISGHLGLDRNGGGPASFSSEVRVVSDAYFETMGIAVLKGRSFDQDDDYGGPRVVVVSRGFADRVLPGKDPLGERIFLDQGPESGLEIVGVVEDVFHSLGDSRSRETIYRTFRQGVSNEMTFVLRTSDRPEKLAQPAEWALHRVDPNLPGFSIASMAAVVSESRSQHRVLVVLFGTFGLLTLTLSALGIYGVVSFAVARRGQEIGIRLALGGSRTRILQAFLGEGIRSGILGSVVGIMAAAGLSRFLSGVLFAVRPVDPWVFLGAFAFTVAMAATASLVSALDALEVDPTQTLRGD